MLKASLIPGDVPASDFQQWFGSTNRDVHQLLRHDDDLLDRLAANERLQAIQADWRISLKSQARACVQ
jgi:hypothetical protein